jgi:hypothetical protein
MQIDFGLSSVDYVYARRFFGMLLELEDGGINDKDPEFVASPDDLTFPCSVRGPVITCVGISVLYPPSLNKKRGVLNKNESLLISVAGR